MDGKAISAATNLSIPRACWSRCSSVFQTDDRSRSSARSRPCSTRRSSRTRRASPPSDMSFARRCPRGRDRRRHGVRPLERRATADRRAPPALRGRQAAAGPDDDVHEQHGAARSRRAGAARRPDQGLVRHVVDATPREGVDLPSRERLLDCVHRLVESHALGAGSRTRVERARLGSAQSGCRREDGGGLHELLGEQGLRRVRRRGVRAAHRGARRDGRHAPQPDRDSSSVRSRRRCSSTSLSPATRATIATCSSRRPGPGRR